MITEIRLPQLNANETSAILTEWVASDGTRVAAGEPLCSVETTKTTFEVEATVGGFVRHALSRGTEVYNNAILAWIADTHEELSTLSSESAGGEPSVVATEKAVQLARVLGVDVSKVSVRGGIVREKDVREFAQGLLITDPRPKFFVDNSRGRLAPDFLKEITANRGFAGLDSAEKIRRYKAAGAEIGPGVTIGLGAILIAENIVLEADSTIGVGCQIKCESFHLGRMSVIGDRASIVTRHVRIGDVFFSGPEILIGGGGAFGKGAYLKTGHSCLVSGWCILNTGNGIELGDEVGLSPHVKLYTHNHWQNVLEGYHSNFGPIVVESRAYITGDALVVPNVRIGEGATILANSTVVSDVLPFTVVAGVPAKKIGDVNRPTSPEAKERIFKRLMQEMREEIGEQPEGVPVLFQKKLDTASLISPAIVLTFAVGGEDIFTLDGVTVFDLSAYRVLGSESAASDEVRNFLRKRGIRFSPIYWRYRRDTKLYNG